MKIPFRLILVSVVLMLCQQANADLPPGWSYTISPSSHIFSIPESAWPMINSNPIEPGDYIGVFYDDNGVQKCGGAIEWPGEGGTAIFAYGDDAITSEKDGFAYQEPIQWKIYSWSLQAEVSATVQLDPSYPTPGDVFIPDGLSGVINISGGGFFVFAYAEEDNPCQGYTTQLHADPFGGSGTYIYEWTSEPPGFTSTEQHPFVTVNDTTIYTVTVNEGTYTAQDHVTVNAIPHPEAWAGNDDTICRNMIYHCSATTTNAPSITWVTTGDGEFNFIHSPDAIYTPGEQDKTNGGTNLILEGHAAEPCDIIARDTMHLAILAPPIAYAGEDITDCENTAIALSGEAENYSAIEWISNGYGSFSDPYALNTTYYSESISQQTDIILTLEVTGNAPCGTSYDYVEITLMPDPQSNAGNDQLICADAVAHLNGSAEYFTSLAWSTSGDGTFDDNTLPNAQYTPGTNDLASDEVYLRLTAFPAAPCQESHTDSMLVTFSPLPEVFAGYDQTLCETENATLSGYAANTVSVLWTTQGDGTFEDPQAASATYFPGSQDISNESVVLTFTGNANAPCTGSVDDEITLYLIPQPVAFAGDDGETCINDTYTVNGAISNTSTSHWNTSGTGIFEDPSLLTTTYIPSEEDYSAGAVTLTLTAEANMACQAVSDDLTLSFLPLPDVNAGENQVIPFGTFTQLNGAVSGGSGSYTHQWYPPEKVVGQGILNPVTVNLESSEQFTLVSTDDVSGCQGQDAMTVFVTGGPLTITATATPTTLCPGESTQLQAIPSGGSGDYTITWSSEPPGFTSADPEPVVIPEITTTYTAEVSDGFNQSESSVTVTVYELPVVNAGEDQSIWHGTSTTLSGNATGGSGEYSWSWTPAALTTDPTNAETQTIQLNEPILFLLGVTDEQTGCKAADDIMVNMSSGPLAVAPESSENTVCVGSEFQLFANPSGGAPEYTYSWFSEPPGYFSTEANPVFSIEEETRFHVEVNDGWNIVSGYTDVSVYPVNQLYIEAFPDDTVCCGETITLSVNSMLGAQEWLWNPGGYTAPAITVDTTGLGPGSHVFTVQVTDSYGCVTEKSIGIYFDLCLSTNNYNLQELTIYPNPAKDYFQVMIPEGWRNGTMKIIRLSTGATILRETPDGRDQVILSTKSIQKGVYMVIIHNTEKKTIYRKLVIL